MALIKMLNVGDELVFDLKQKAGEANEISITLAAKSGRVGVLQIRADKSILIRHFRQTVIRTEECHKTA